MEITISYLKEAFEKYNKEYFKDKLREPEFIISHEKNALGRCCYPRDGKGYRIKISDYYVRPQKDIDNTLIHEMIHLYIRQQHIKDNRAHGYKFQEMAWEINKHGWDIHRTNSVAGCKVRYAEDEVYSMFAYKNYKGQYFLFRVLNSKTEYYAYKLDKDSWYYKEWIHFTSTDSAKYGNFRACRSAIYGRFITNEQFNQLAPSNDYQRLVAI
jgi:hypothetical protein